MAQKRNPNRDKAYQIWQKSKGSKPLKDIAKEIGVTPSTIRKWKSTDKWSLGGKRSAPIDKERYASMKENKNAVGNHGGAPPGNNNAVGYGAPSENKNALVTGEYETISFAYLSDEERRLFAGVTDDPLITINTQIRELKIRRYRILGRMQALRNSEEPESSNFINMYINKKGERKVSGWSVSGSREFDDMLKLEDALNAVDNSLLRANQQKQHMIESGTAASGNDSDEPDSFFDALQSGISKNGLTGDEEGSDDDA